MSRMINTPEEADTVTIGSVVITANDVIAQRSTSKHAMLFGFDQPVHFDGLQLPLVVLYTPEPVDVRELPGYNSSQHCTGIDCLTFSHTAESCSTPQPRFCHCHYDYPDGAPTL